MKQLKGHDSMNDKINKILFHWGMQNNQVTQTGPSTWQVGDEYVLKVYRDMEMLERNLKILRILDEIHIPVNKVVTTKDNEQYISSEDVFWFMSKKLLGNNIVQIGNNMSIALMMGEIIGDLHVALKKCEEVDEFWNNSLLDEMNGWVKNNFESNNWKHISKSEYEKIVSQLAMIIINCQYNLFTGMFILETSYLPIVSFPAI